MLPVRKLIFICLLLFAVQLACALGPQPSGRPTPAGVQPTQTTNLPPSAAIPEQRLLILDYPPAIRAGDSDVVRLTLELDENGNLTPTVSANGNLIQGQVVSIPNVYDTHNIMAEARLDMAGLDIRPGDTITETLLPGQKLTFYWSVLPQDVGKYKGTVWFYLRFIPNAGGPESRQAISAQIIEIEATSFFGLRANLARWLGLGGTLLSTILGLPFLETALKTLRLHLRRPPTPQK